MNLRQAAQQALEALEWVWGGEPLTGKELDAITALKRALAEPEQEPVGQLQEEAYGRGQVLWFKKPADQSMLYTTPTPRKPLTDEEIEAMWQNTSPYYDHQDFARAIEAAHGITGEQT